MTERSCSYCSLPNPCGTPIVSCTASPSTHAKETSASSRHLDLLAAASGFRPQECPPTAVALVCDSPWRDCSSEPRARLPQQTPCERLEDCGRASPTIRDFHASSLVGTLLETSESQQSVVEVPASHRGRRGVAMARRDYENVGNILSEAQRRQRGCIAGRMQPDFRRGLPGPRGVCRDRARSPDPK